MSKLSRGDRRNQTQPPRAYLTALWGIALGIVWLVALAACSKSDGVPAGTQESASGTRTPYATRTRFPGNSPATITPTGQAGRTPAATPRDIRASEEDLDGVRIVFWHAWAGELEDVLEDIVKEFNRTNRWGITVEVRAYDGIGAVGDAFALARQEGKELPDLLSGFNYQALQWDVGGQVLVDLSAYVDDKVLGFSAEEVRDFLPVFWSQDVVMVNTPAGRIEKRLGIPLHGSAQVLYYNLTWAEELGYDELPDSPFNLRTQACKASEGPKTTQDEEVLGGWMLTTEAPTLLGWIYAYGGDVNNPQANGYRFDSEETARALEFLHGMVNAGCAWVGEDLEAADAFAARQALVYAGSMAGLDAQAAAMRQADNRDQWTVMAFPSGDGVRAIVASGPALAVTQSTPEEELAAWLLIRWLVSPQNQAGWVRASGLYPTRESTLEFMETKLAEDEHWKAAVELLPYLHSEPGYASWRVMRWALGDALRELFSIEFDVGEIPGLLKRLDAVAEEIHTQVR